MRQTILLDGDAREQSGIASEALTPGMLVEFGGSDDYQAHSTPGGAAAAAFVRQQHEHEGRGIDDDIASGDEATVLYPTKGAKINALTADTIERGEFVQSAGDGMVAPFDSGEIIGVADADSDLSGDNGRVAIIVI